MYLYSYDLEKIAAIPTTAQREAAHGLKEDVQIDINNMFTADGIVFAKADGEWYRLNADTYEWERYERLSAYFGTFVDFCGKYRAIENVIYDRTTEEPVFECGELYPPACVVNRAFNLCYFGGDKYFGKTRSEARWVNLTDLSMSDPLPFPTLESEYSLFILNDTYCVYKDKYGWFLWNYNTGEEETIVMFEQ